MTQPAPRIDFANLPSPEEGILVTLFITVRKVARSRDFGYMNPGGPPTPDKPGISVVDYQPGDTTSIFLNLRVADIRHTALRTRMARSNPSSAQYQREVMGCGAPIGKAKTPPGRSVRCTPANSAGRSAGRKLPDRSEADRQVEGPGEGQARTSARTHVASGCARRAWAARGVLKPDTLVHKSRQGVFNAAGLPL